MPGCLSLPSIRLLENGTSWPTGHMLCLVDCLCLLGAGTGPADPGRSCRGGAGGDFRSCPGRPLSIRFLAPLGHLPGVCDRRGGRRVPPDVKWELRLQMVAACDTLDRLLTVKNLLFQMVLQSNFLKRIFKTR